MARREEKRRERKTALTAIRKEGYWILSRRRIRIAALSKIPHTSVDTA
jgi:hypothetical protein